MREREHVPLHLHDVVLWLVGPAFLVGCSDQGLSPVVGAPDSDGAEAIGSVSEAHDYPKDTSEPASCLSPVAPEASATGTATCGPLSAVTWEMAIEATFVNGDEFPYLGQPIVLPWPGGGRAALGYTFDDGAVEGARFLFLDDYTTAVEIDGTGGGDDCTAAAWEADGEVRFAVASGVHGVTCADSSGATTFWANEGLNQGVGVVDVDHDGHPDYLAGDDIVTQECSSIFEGPNEELPYTTTVVPTLDAGTELFLNGGGITSLADGDTTPWDWPWTAGPSAMGAFAGVRLADGTLAAMASNREVVMVTGLDGIPIWIDPPAHDSEFDFSDTFAIGDVDGDGEAELVYRDRTNLKAVRLDGEVLWSQYVIPRDWYVGVGGITLADLDADGTYEILDWGMAGLRILDGHTGATLGAREDLQSNAAWSSPVVADVDGDGSMEILVTGDLSQPDGTLYILGPTSGRWARGRPVYNQRGYDITSVHDDGTVVRFPRPNWQTYNAFRAQPSHDGDHPDLTARVVQACADTCADGDTVYLEVVVENLGSKEAPAGTELTVSTWDGVMLSPVASATIADPIPSMEASAGVVLEVPYTSWGTARVVDVVSPDPEECDLVNDRVDILDDPCPQ